MRVFVTGATGWVGSAVVADLLNTGHQVLGLARSDAGAQTVAAAGAQVHRGSLEDPRSLADGAAQADAVIHTAFSHDFSKLQQNCEDERLAIEAMGEVLAGSHRPLIVTSGVALLAPGTLATEDSPLRPLTPDFPRSPEHTAGAFTDKGVRVSCVRLAPTVHGVGDHGFVPHLIAVARQTGVVAYIGDGENRWPAVHRLDAARVYRLALERNLREPDGGAGIYHAVAEQGVPMRLIAEVIGKRLGLPVTSITPEAAQTHFGWFAHFVGSDCPCSSEVTRATLGWEPVQADLLTDLDQPAYYPASA